MSESTQTIQIGNQSHKIVVKPTTLIFSSPQASMGQNYKYPGCYVIDTDETRLQAEYLDDHLDKLHSEFETYWRIFFHRTNPRQEPEWPITKQHIKDAGTGGRHLIGLIDLLLKLQDVKLRIVVRHPESYMHPGWQIGLGNLFIQLSRRG